MWDKGNPQAPQTSAPELNNPDFQFALKALLAAYQPVLEHQLHLAKNPEELEKEALTKAAQQLAFIVTGAQIVLIILAVGSALH